MFFFVVFQVIPFQRLTLLHNEAATGCIGRRAVRVVPLVGLDGGRPGQASARPARQLRNAREPLDVLQVAQGPRLPGDVQGRRRRRSHHCQVRRVLVRPHRSLLSERCRYANKNTHMQTRRCLLSIIKYTNILL